MKKGAIFDMDGLLFDTEKIYQESWIVMAEEFGLVPHPDFPGAVCGTSGVIMEEVVRRYYPTVNEKEFIRRAFRRVEQQVEISVDEKPGVHEILEFFHGKGVKIAVASSSVELLIWKNLKRAGIETYFDTVVCGAQVKRGKPEPDIFLLAARKLGLKPEDCYVFEDGINGVRAGVSAGCVTVMIPDVIEPTDEIREMCAGVCGSLLEAAERIENGEL